MLTQSCFNLMDFRLLLLLGITTIFLAACDCQEDEFGQELSLILPISTTLNTDTINIGDTITIIAEFPKEIAVEGSNNRILLENFNFFTEISISEISDTIERYNLDIEVIEEIGQVDVLPLQTAISRPIMYQEGENAYKFKAKFVFNTSGLMYLFFYSSPLLFERYNHPSMFACKDNRRSRVEVHYQNSSTSQERYNNLFLSTNVDYLPEVFPVNEYEIAGAQTFVVKEP